MTDETTPTRSDAVLAIEQAGLLDHDEDSAHVCLDERNLPFAVATNRTGTDVSFAFAVEEPRVLFNGFCTHFLDTEGTNLLARALSVRVGSRDELSLLEQALAVLDEVASACDVDPKLRARVSGLDALRARIRERVGS